MVIDNFGEFAKKIPLKYKYSQAIVDEISKILKTSKSKPNLIKTNDGKEYVNKIFKNFLEQIKTKIIFPIILGEQYLQNALIEP